MNCRPAAGLRRCASGGSQPRPAAPASRRPCPTCCGHAVAAHPARAHAGTRHLHSTKSARSARAPARLRSKGTAGLVAASSGRADPQTEPTSLREQTISTIKSQAPFVIDPSAVADSVKYSSPLEYQYADGSGAPQAETTQMGVIYSSTVPREQFVAALQAFNQRTQSLRSPGLQILRSFQPDPDAYIVRWRISWAKDGRKAAAEGSSKYTLDRQGQIARQEDAWELCPSEEDKPPLFRDVLDFALLRVPPGKPVLAFSLPAIRQAAWEALKDNPDYGGQLTREELDGFTMQMVFACGGLAVSMAFLVGRVLFLAANK